MRKTYPERYTGNVITSAFTRWLINFPTLCLALEDRSSISFRLSRTNMLRFSVGNVSITNISLSCKI
jgi:hypothetical protein